MTDQNPDNVPPPEGQTPPPSESTPPPQPVDYETPSPGGYTGPPPDSDSRTMGMLSHLLGIVLGFLGPLIIWLIKKDSSPFVDDQGKEALNFQLTLLIGYIIAGATTIICIGAIIGPAVWIVGLIFAIMGGMEANKGQAYRYPINIRFIK